MKPGHRAAQGPLWHTQSVEDPPGGLPERSPDGSRDLGCLDREHRPVHDQVARSRVRIIECPSQQAPFIAM